MTTENLSALGVCLAPAASANVPRTCEHAHYVHEILAHAGVCYRTVDAEQLAAVLPTLRVLVTIGELPIDEDVQGALADWVADGGAWIAVAGVCGLSEVLGVDVEQPYMPIWGGGPVTLGEGYMESHARVHPIFAGIWRPLHFYGGLAVTPAGAEVLAFALDAHQGALATADEPPRAALTERPYGEGLSLLIAPDLTGAVVRIQQGVAVTRDGLAAPDGSATRADGALKSDDGVVLDWWLDRTPVPGVPGFRAFLDPVADNWRTLLLRTIFHAARTVGLSLPVLWMYPRNVPAIAELSHDTDLCEAKKAHTLLETLDAVGVRSTWCVILPGYPTDTIEAIRAGGHELAMHYDAMTEGTVWSEEEFRGQKASVTDIIGAPPRSNKNHYLRWQGDTEFFEWCIRAGIRLDQTKGASKTGEAGFLFGSCHPYRPVAPDGSLLDVYELPTPTQDLTVFCPVEILEPLSKAIAQAHGVWHLLFHPAHVETPGVADALRKAVARARGLGMEFWTAEAIADWEDARRAVQWGTADMPGGATATTVRTAVPMEDATLLMLDTGAPPVVTIDGEDYPCLPVERWGFPFHAVTLDLDANRTHVLEGSR